MADAPAPNPDPTINPSDPAIKDATPAPADPVGGTTPPVETVAQEKYDELQAELDKFKVMATSLGEAGITSADQLTTRLKQPSSEDFTKLIQDALKPSTDPPAVPTKPEALTLEAVQKLISDSASTVQKAQDDRVYSDAATQEAELKTRVLSDPAFKATMQGATFEQACKGEKGLAAKILATYADHLFFERGLTGPDGAYRPVTSAEAVSGIVEDLRKTVLELRASALVAGSTDPSVPESPDGPATPVEPVQASLTEDTALLDEDEQKQRRKEDDAVRRTFEQSYKQAVAAERGMPASQSV